LEELLLDEFELELLEELELELFDEFDDVFGDVLELELFDEFDPELDDTIVPLASATAGAVGAVTAAAGSVMASTTLHHILPCPRPCRLRPTGTVNRADCRDDGRVSHRRRRHDAAGDDATCGDGY
jgi:hypothetical protein